MSQYPGVNQINRDPGELSTTRQDIAVSLRLAFDYVYELGRMAPKDQRSGFHSWRNVESPYSTSGRDAAGQVVEIADARNVRQMQQQCNRLYQMLLHGKLAREEEQKQQKQPA